MEKVKVRKIGIEFTIEEEQLIGKVIERKRRGEGYKVKRPSLFSPSTEEGQRCYCLAALIEAELDLFREPKKAVTLPCYREISILAQKVVSKYFEIPFKRVVCQFVLSYDRGPRETRTVRALLRLI